MSRDYTVLSCLDRLVTKIYYTYTWGFCNLKYLCSDIRTTLDNCINFNLGFDNNY